MAELRTALRDAIVFCALVAAFTGLQLGLSNTQVPDWLWLIAVSVLATIVVMFGAAAFALLKSAYPIRFVFVLATPVFTQLAMERIGPTDPAYPGISLVMIWPLAVLFLFGAVGAAMFKRLRRRQEKPSNPTIERDARKTGARPSL